MKWNVYVTIQGPEGTSEIPSNTNPIDAEDMQTLIRGLDLPTPQFLGIPLQYVGLRIEQVKGGE